MRAALFTFGCKLNQSESEALASSLKRRGFFLVGSTEPADLYVINTCTVTSKSEQKARRIIRKLSAGHPESAVLVTGCYAQLNPDDISTLGENVAVLSHENKDRILDLSSDFLQEYRGGPDKAGALVSELSALHREAYSGAGRFRYNTESYEFHARPLLKIQDGCDNRCAYCRVPLARGNSVSLPMPDVIERFRALEQRGYGEIVLTGVNITAYKDPVTSTGLTGLLYSLLRESDTARIRLSSIEPEMTDRDFAEAAAHPRIRPHFHFPVQSGSDAVLTLMGRKYRADKVRKAVDQVRRVKTDPFIAGDFIVGFPGESDDDFRRTEELIREIGFSKLHVFQFSPRPGTAAFSFLHKVPERTAGERSRVLRKLSEDLFRTYVKNWAGRETEAVLEKKEETVSREFQVWKGTAANYIPVRVFVPAETEAERGRGCTVLLSEGFRGCSIDVEGTFLKWV